MRKDLNPPLPAPAASFSRLAALSLPLLLAISISSGSVLGGCSGQSSERPAARLAVRVAGLTGEGVELHAPPGDYLLLAQGLVANRATDVVFALSTTRGNIVAGAELTRPAPDTVLDGEQAIAERPVTLLPDQVSNVTLNLIWNAGGQNSGTDIGVDNVYSPVIVQHSEAPAPLWPQGGQAEVLLGLFNPNAAHPGDAKPVGEILTADEAVQIFPFLYVGPRAISDKQAGELYASTVAASGALGPAFISLGATDVQGIASNSAIRPSTSLRRDSSTRPW